MVSITKLVLKALQSFSNGRKHIFRFLFDNYS